MSEPESSSTTTPTTMIVCPTTHNDWDWQVTFETYYNDGTGSGSNQTQSVRRILDSVTRIFDLSYDQPINENAEFRFSYAEVGFLRQYLEDIPHKALSLRRVEDRFCLLGGGITSPDNQTSHGEVFIRNYLTGHDYLKSVDLIDQVFFVAWLPDDFGHDPQLPVLIEALGMKAIGLSRIPGSVQPKPCTSLQHAATDARANGLSFYWSANDGSTMLTHFMPATYYGITNYANTCGLTDPECEMQQFIQENGDGVVWPGGVIFATEGGDWQYPTTSAPYANVPGAYNWASVIGATVTSGDITVTSQLGTFEDYYNALMKSPGDIPSFTLYAENYWTGYFASRPQLKIDHYQAARLLLGAEVLGSILTVYAGTTSQDQADLSEAIADGWNLLVPTTHHDYITGTSPDSIYQVSNPPSPEVWDSSGQLPMSTQALALAQDAMNLAMAQLATATAPSLPGNEIPVVVFNQLGSDLPDTVTVEIDDPSGGMMDYEVLVGTTRGPVQRSSDYTLLFQVPGMRSMAYQIVYLLPLGGVDPPTRSLPASGDFTFRNDVVTLEVSQSNGWAITQITTSEGNSYIQPGDTCANQISLWQDDGNLYQFGMEFVNGNCGTGTFAWDSNLNGGTGSLVERGPVRWRFIGNLQDRFGNNYTTQYDLIQGETQVRITTTGAAPEALGPANQVGTIGWSVLTSFPMQMTTGETASVLEYGTSYYWENRDPQQSWNGLTFRASRDFAQLATAAGDAVAAVYHNGIPAWTIDGSVLRGCLLRNTPAGGRGAYGTDTDSHTQRYTLDVEPQPAVTGHPLRTALYTQTPLHAAVLSPGTGATMPEAAQLASVAQPDALLRVGKINPPSDGGPDLILRVQRSGTGSEQLDITLPFLAGEGSVTPEIVTALETTPERQTVVTVSGTTASFMADRAVWTMKVPGGTASAS
ncbi:MAG: ybgG [Chlorobi bacterium]|nr:ybgG [Chlorobiota bacterium]